MYLYSHTSFEHKTEIETIYVVLVIVVIKCFKEQAQASEQLNCRQLLPELSIIKKIARKGQETKTKSHCLMKLENVLCPEGTRNKGIISLLHKTRQFLMKIEWKGQETRIYFHCPEAKI